jgi:hypothetical protein
VSSVRKVFVCVSWQKEIVTKVARKMLGVNFTSLLEQSTNAPAVILLFNFVD